MPPGPNLAPGRAVTACMDVHVHQSNARLVPPVQANKFSERLEAATSQASASSVSYDGPLRAERKDP